MFGFFKSKKKEAANKIDLENKLYELTQVRKTIRLVEGALRRDYITGLSGRDFEEVLDSSASRVDLWLEADKKYLKSCIERYAEEDGFYLLESDPQGLYPRTVKSIIRDKVLTSPVQEIITAMKVPGRFDSGFDSPTCTEYVLDRDLGVKYTHIGDRSLTVRLPGPGQVHRDGQSLGLSNYEQVIICREIRHIIEREKQISINKAGQELLDLYTQEND